MSRILRVMSASTIVAGLALVASAPPASADTKLSPTAEKLVVDLARAHACFNNPPDATLAPAAVVTPTWPFARTPVPAAPQAFFWGGGLGCPRQFVVEIPVTKETLPPAATSVAFGLTVGGRNGKWEKPSFGMSFITSDELAPECKTLDGPCVKAKMSERCPRMTVTSTNAWKKSGETTFTVFRSVMLSMSYDPSTSSCVLDPQGPGNENYDGQALLTPAQVNASGVYRVPPPGQTDHYRFVLAAGLRRFSTSGAGGTWPGTPQGAVTNPVVEQYPVGIYIKPK